MTDRFRPALIAAILLLFAGVARQSNADEAASGYSLLLVRHAEKTSGGFDPELTDYGQSRAQFLAGWRSALNVRTIWSSDFKRTRNTVRPLADKLGLDIYIYDPGNQYYLVDDLLTAKVNAVVVGHSNTIPALAAMLCKCEVAPMEDTEYERAFLIEKTGDSTDFSEINLNEIWTDRPAADH